VCFVTSQQVVINGRFTLTLSRTLLGTGLEVKSLSVLERIVIHVIHKEKILFCCSWIRYPYLSVCAVYKDLFRNQKFLNLFIVQ
jgi:hypothetical protein